MTCATSADLSAPLPESDFLPATLPVPWRTLLGERSGTVQFRRRFNWPNALDPHTRVQLVLTDLRGTATARLNECPLVATAAAQRWTADVTPRLALRNRLELEITHDPQQWPDAPGGLWQPVVLEIVHHP